MFYKYQWVFGEHFSEYPTCVFILYLCLVIWITVMGDQSDDRTINPLYLRDSDIQCSDEGWITDFDLMNCVIQIVRNSLHCLQLDRNLWRIYLKDVHSRRQLQEGIVLRNVLISLFDTSLTHLETITLTRKLWKSGYAVYRCPLMTQLYMNF